MASTQPPIVMYEETDPEEIRKFQERHRRFQRNVAWLDEHAWEVFPRYRGKCIAVAGEELFVAETAEEVRALARRAHPEDDGYFVQYIPREKLPRIYACKRRLLGSVQLSA